MGWVKVYDLLKKTETTPTKKWKGASGIFGTIKLPRRRASFLCTQWRKSKRLNK
jgi:hypothetical protein